LLTLILPTGGILFTSTTSRRRGRSCRDGISPQSGEKGRIKTIDHSTEKKEIAHVPGKPIIYLAVLYILLFPLCPVLEMEKFNFFYASF
jgi:hypothetical protein